MFLSFEDIIDPNNPILTRDLSIPIDDIAKIEYFADAKVPGAAYTRIDTITDGHTYHTIESVGSITRRINLILSRTAIERE